MTPGTADLVASNEDGIEWVTRAGVTRRRALAYIADYSGERVTLLNHTTRRRHMRPFQAGADCTEAPGDCTARTPGADGLCSCETQADEGWMLVCGPEHPDALPVWQIESRYGLIPWPIKRRLRALHPAQHRRTVLWGGHVDRRARWFDRLLLGRGYLLVAGDHWQRTYATVELERARWRAESEARRKAWRERQGSR